MTPQERENPSILNSSRKKRIAAGCGLQVVSVNRLLKEFEMMQQMTKQMSKMAGKRRKGKFGKMPGGFPGGMPGLPFR
jgi:signal recognition particle subunit SRP54